MWESLCAMFADPDFDAAMGKAVSGIGSWLMSDSSSGGGVMSSNLMAGVGMAIKGVGALGLGSRSTPAPQAHSSPFHYQNTAHVGQAGIDLAKNMGSESVNAKSAFGALKNLF